MPVKQYKHKTIRRFRVGKFEFKNHKLTIESEEDQALFEKMVSDLPVRDSREIVIVNQEAIAASETKIGDTVVRGPMSADDILTAKDRERINAGSGMAASMAALLNK
jgi:hypothetical protein